MLSKLGSHVRYNVVGYIALFFALTGVAYAAGPLKPGDPAGGDLTGTYPEPTIAAGKISGGSGGKIADNTVTGDDILESSLGKVGDADTLDGKDSTDFVSATTLVTRSFNPAGIGFGPNECATFSNVALPGGNPVDPVFISGADGSGIVFSASLAAGTPRKRQHQFAGLQSDRQQRLVPRRHRRDKARAHTRLTGTRASGRPPLALGRQLAALPFPGGYWAGDVAGER